MKVLLPLHGFISWNGGLDFVRLLIAALRQPGIAEQIDLRIAFPNAGSADERLARLLRRLTAIYARLRGITVPPQGDHHRLRQIATEIIGDLPRFDCGADVHSLIRAAARSGADIVFPSAIPLPAGRDSPMRRISYLPDFQHRHLPELFSPRLRRNRDRNFRRLVEHADGLLVNSEAVAADAERFLGFPRDRILALPFAPYAQPWWFDADPAEVAASHGIEGPYLMVCNHFWVHKDHCTALEAFAQIVAAPSHGGLKLVLTGDPVDHRDPAHFGRIRHLAERLGIVGRVFFLGLIPKHEQLALLRGSRLLIQPTRFEGGPGGGSVYESVGLGIPSVVSDIAVNREIRLPGVRFFATGNASNLAEQTLAMLEVPAPMRSPEDLVHEGNQRLAVAGAQIIGFLRGGRVLKA